MIKIPAILFTHRSPVKFSFFLKSATPELRERNHKHEPIKTPATRDEIEKNPDKFPKPSAANTTIKAKMVKGLESVRKTMLKYDFNKPPPLL